jgi:hypothetical protein
MTSVRLCRGLQELKPLDSRPGVFFSSHLIIVSRSNSSACAASYWRFCYFQHS